MILDVREFREKFNLAYSGLPRALPDDGSQNVRHMNEELGEFEFNHLALLTAVKNNREQDVKFHLEQCLDALVDLVYVAVGTADKMGFLEPTGSGEVSRFAMAWNRVHAANMTKELAGTADRSLRGDPNDVVKPKSFVHPDHGDLVKPNVYFPGE